MNNYYYGKILLIMRIALFLLIGINFAVQASGFGQKVTLNVKNEPIERVFDAINKQTKYRFLYNDALITKNVPAVSLKVKNESLERVLQKLFSELNLDYKIISRTISITTKESIGKPIPTLETVQQLVRGAVVDEKELPLWG